MTDLSLTRLPLLALLALGAASFSAGCSAVVDPSEEGVETEVATDDITSVVQSSVKNQSIGNCWIYAHVGWVESMNKRATNTELNLSESYATYWDWFTKVTSWPDTAIDSKGEFSAGGTWSLYRWEVARFGSMLEKDFIPEEAEAARSSRQGSAIRAFTESLKNGALKTVEARKDRALVRAELDKAFGLTPDVVKKLDDVFGKGASFTATTAGKAKRDAAGILGPQDVKIAWPNARSSGQVLTGILSDAVQQGGSKSWVEVRYPEDEAGRRTYQIRIQKAHHLDGAVKQPVEKSNLHEHQQNSKPDSRGTKRQLRKTRGRVQPSQRRSHTVCFNSFPMVPLQDVEYQPDFTFSPPSLSICISLSTCISVSYRSL